MNSSSTEFIQGAKGSEDENSNSISADDQINSMELENKPAPRFNGAGEALIQEILANKSRNGTADKKLSSDKEYSNPRSHVCCSCACAEDNDEENHGGDNEDDEEASEKLISESLCPSGSCSSTHPDSRTRKTNGHLWVGQNCKPNTNDITIPGPKFRLRVCSIKCTTHSASTELPGLQNGMQSNCLLDRPIVSLEKTLGSLDSHTCSAASNLNSSSVHFPSRTVDDLYLQVPGKSKGPRLRKISIPLLKPSSSSLELPNSDERPSSPVRRKLSNVSDVVTRKISSTIGWRTGRGAEEVVPQAKYLCSQYIRCRLKRAGLLHKKIGLQRIRSVVNLHWGLEVCEVFPRLLTLGHELERCHPNLYCSIVRQISVSLKSDKVVRHVMLALSSHLLRTDVTWARIISLYALAAALAADCVRQGHPEFVSSVVEGVGMAIERHSCQWIASQGGWSGVLVWSQPPAFELTPMQMLTMVGAAGVGIAALIGGAFSLLDHLMS
ncbi:uncharacterized protein LOC108670844 [Hyalella azteca]|uniref:Uncharacterized protein LOC108670844 n=1 Tax=Hyalella azteca TaxID=294128 RepID=A0A8B7NJK4_HYAAZ|nr:uncharacterized protein LOC108670844 [Hyalella azteca]